MKDKIQEKEIEMIFDSNMLKMSKEELMRISGRITDKIKIEDGWISIDCPNMMMDTQDTYEIELSRIKTETQLLGWMHHLFNKRWMDRPMLREFMDKVAEYKHFNLDHIRL